MKNNDYKRLMNIRNIINELDNRCLHKERKELLNQLYKYDVYTGTFSDYKAGREEEDRKYNIKEFYDTQAWILERFFPICTDEGNIFIEIQPIEYDEDTYIMVEWEDESDLIDE